MIWGQISNLTPREVELLGLMARGRSNRAIGEDLFVSPRTVETHVRSIYQKLVGDESEDVNRRVLAVLRYVESVDDSEANAA